MALSQTMTLQASGKDSLRFMPETLTLTAACVWLTNSLHARPEDGPASRRLMDAALPLTDPEGVSDDVLAYKTSTAARPPEDEEEEEEGEEGEEEENDHPRASVPYSPHGCIFLRRMMVGDVPRLRVGGPVLAARPFRYWFAMTPEQVAHKYRHMGVLDKAALAGKRATTNKRVMPVYLAAEDEPDLFTLGARGHVLPPPLEDGSDIEDRDSPPPEQPRTIDSFLSRLWRQFIIDLAGKSPNPRGPAKFSYLILTDIQRRTATDAIFKNLTLSAVFRAVTYRNAPTADWRRAFKWLFPERGFATTNTIQNYRQCPYFHMWLGFLQERDNSNDLVNEARQELWKRVRTLEWIPDAQQDRIWPTKVVGGFTRWPPSGTNRPRPAPRILLKHQTIPRFREDRNSVDEGEDIDVL